MQTLLGRWDIRGRNVRVKSKRNDRNNPQDNVDQKDEKMRDGKMMGTESEVTEFWKGRRWGRRGEETRS